MNKIDIRAISESSFPSVDFEFQNTGNATASISQFGIQIRDLKIDRSPVLYGSLSVDTRNSICVNLHNAGWGERVLCRAFFDDSRIMKLAEHSFSPECLELESSEHSSIDIDFNRFDRAALVNLLKSLKKLRQVSGISRPRFTTTPNDNYTNNSEGWPITSVTVEYRSMLSKNDKADWKTISIHARHDEQIYLTEEGFQLERDIICYSMGRADTRYAAIVDVDLFEKLGEQEKVYPISRIIAPGEIDKFEIICGATKSCTFTAIFSFLLEDGAVIRSSPFEISITNDRSQSLHRSFEDGEAIFDGDTTGGLDRFGSSELSEMLRKLMEEK